MVAQVTLLGDPHLAGENDHAAATGAFDREKLLRVEPDERVSEGGVHGVSRISICSVDIIGGTDCDAVTMSKKEISIAIEAGRALDANCADERGYDKKNPR